jgi:hypothetical protein
MEYGGKIGKRKRAKSGSQRVLLGQNNDGANYICGKYGRRENNGGYDAKRDVYKRGMGLLGRGERGVDD